MKKLFLAEFFLKAINFLFIIVDLNIKNLIYMNKNNKLFKHYQGTINFLHLHLDQI